MGSISKIIKKQPDLIQKILYKTIPFQYRYGNVFKKTYDFLIKSEGWTLDKLKQYQLNELNLLLIHCYDNIPYYTKVFNELDLTPKDIQSIDDLKKLPILDKKTINDNFDLLIDKNIKKDNLFLFKTSGSTGERLKFYGDDSVYKKEAAFILRAYHSHGATMYDEPSIWIRRYVPKTENEPLLYYDFELKRLYISAYHLTRQHLLMYMDEIKKRKYHTLVGYPSSVYVLACMLEDECKDMLGAFQSMIKAIHVTSEMFLPEWKEKIESVFGIAPKAHYGLIEKVSFFYQPGFSDNYCEALEYGVTEFIDNEFGSKSVVGTGFLNYAMPFLRYKTDDLAILNNDVGTVGLPLTVRIFEGRTSDLLISKNNQQLPGVNFYSMMSRMENIKMFQFIQEDRNNLTANLVTSKLFTLEELDRIKKELTQRLGDVNIKFCFLDSIPRDNNTGKIRCIINKVK